MPGYIAFAAALDPEKYWDGVDMNGGLVQNKQGGIFRTVETPTVVHGRGFVFNNRLSDGAPQSSRISLLLLQTVPHHQGIDCG